MNKMLAKLQMGIKVWWGRNSDDPFYRTIPTSVMHMFNHSINMTCVVIFTEEH